VLADVFPLRLRLSAEFNPNYEDYGVTDEIHVSLDRGRRWGAELAVFRPRDYGERERLILQLLEPHLAVLYRASKLRYRLGAAHDAACLLTQRELQIMKHVRDGLRNAEIARELVIQPSTVRKHLEHVFDKLDVSSRTAALAKLHAQLTDDS
jgi:DNA-binding NarL/FixJ family response regulator